MNNIYILITNIAVWILKDVILNPLAVISIIVTVAIFKRQGEDSQIKIEDDKNSNSPYFTIEIGGEVCYEIEDKDNNKGVYRYINQVEEYLKEQVSGMDFYMNNIGFNWAKVLRVTYEVKIREENIYKFNERFRDVLGKEAVSLTDNGTVIVGIGGRNIIFFSGRKYGVIDIFLDTERGSGKGYKLDIPEGLLEVMMLEEEISKITDYEINKFRESDIYPWLFNIKMEVDYINSDAREELGENNTYIGMRQRTSIKSKSNSDTKITEYNFMYRYSFEREDKYNEILENNEKKLKSIIESKDIELKEQVEEGKL